jgi:hypothetical protein
METTVVSNATGRRNCGRVLVAGSIAYNASLYQLPLLARDLSSCRSCSVRNFASVEREMKTLYIRHELQSLRVLVWSFVCESLASSACNEPMSQ